MINNKPIGAICIASVKIAKVLQSVGRNGKAMGGFDGKILADGKPKQVLSQKDVILKYSNLYSLSIINNSVLSCFNVYLSISRST